MVLAEEGTRDDERFKATITVFSPDGTELGSFAGSTLPDDILGKYDDGGGYATVKPGTYKIARSYDEKRGYIYNVTTLDGDDNLPCYRSAYTEYHGETADEILIHYALPGYTPNPWSTGCITIEGAEKMDEFQRLVGSSAKLIIKR